MSTPGAVAVATIRQRVSAAILAAMTGDGWQQSPIPADQFGTGEGDNLLHKSYAVGCPSTSAFAGRARVVEGSLCETTVLVRWAYNLAALDQLTDYDAALGVEGALIVGAMDASNSANLKVTYVSSIRPVDDQGWMMGEITLRALHLFALN